MTLKTDLIRTNVAQVSDVVHGLLVLFILKICYNCIFQSVYFNHVLFVPSLGSDHDGWFRGKQCDASNGYIMASISPLTTNGFYFSQCTINSIKTNLM